MIKQRTNTCTKKRIKDNYVSLQSKCHLIPPPVRSIKPRPIIREDLQSLSKSQRFVVRGYKYVSKALASGEHTHQILKNIRSCTSLKLMRRFEFDAFLCDYSGIRALRKVCQKLRMTTNLGLTIRRVDTLNETNLLVPFISRVLRMKRIHIEFPSTTNIDKDGIKALGKYLSKCVSLTILEITCIFMPMVFPGGYSPLLDGLTKLKNVVRFVFHKLCYTIQNPTNDTTVHLGFPKMANLKCLDFKKGVKTGWTDMNQEDEAYLPFYIESVGRTKTIERFTYRFSKYGVTTEILLALTKILPEFPRLRYLGLEFSSCKLMELEFMILLDCLQRCTQIKELTFKVTQRPNVREEHIFQITNCIQTMKNLEKFDIYFRGTELTENDVLIRQLSNIENLGYILTPQSVHLFRDLQVKT